MSNWIIVSKAIFDTFADLGGEYSTLHKLLRARRPSRTCRTAPIGGEVAGRPCQLWRTQGACVWRAGGQREVIHCRAAAHEDVPDVSED